MQALISEL